MMGGRIWVDSEPGVGSTFHFTAAFETQPAASSQPDPDTLANLPVLVVDDHDVNRRILTEQLRHWGMTPTAASGGREALAALSAAARAGHPFRLLLLDAHMPDMDGFAVAEHMAKQPELAGATIMMLTSSGEYASTSRCRDLHIAASLTKPIKGADLFDAILRVVSQRMPVHIVPEVAPAPAIATRSLKVLVAEDNVVNQRVAAGLLSSRGHVVTVAVSGRDAIAALERERFDLVLMDLQMPEMGGLEATRTIRERERSQGGHVRIVAMTAHAMTGDRERCLAAGMDGYLTKPLSRDRLVATVEGRDGGDRARAGAPPAAGALDRARMLEYLGGDEELMLEVVRLFLEDCPRRLAAIASAIEDRAADRLRAAAHALKGSAGNLGAAGLVGAAATLEQMGAAERLDQAPAAARRVASEASTLLDELRLLERMDRVRPT